jgi:hypothetical protein
MYFPFPNGSDVFTTILTIACRGSTGNFGQPPDDPSQVAPFLEQSGQSGVKDGIWLVRKCVITKRLLILVKGFESPWGYLILRLNIKNQKLKSWSCRFAATTSLILIFAF